VSEAAKRLLERVAALDGAVADNRRRSESYQHMADELVRVTGHSTSPDGLVTAVVTAAGALESITFGDDFRTVPPAALAAAVLHATAAARVAATRAQADVVRRGLGDTQLLDAVLAADQQLFGDQRPVEPGPPPAPMRAPMPARAPARARPRPRPRDDETEENYEDFTVMRGRQG
jgi:hypothetical protein